MDPIQAGGLHYAQVSRTSAQTLATATGTPVSFNATAYSSGLTVASGTTPITIVRAGLYRIEWSGGLLVNDQAAFLTYLIIGGTTIQTRRISGSGASKLWNPQGSHTAELTAGQTVGMGMYHENGANADTQTGADYRPTLTVTEVR